MILVGTIGFFVIEKDWSLWQSLYFTLITITTVGYDDEGISSAGEKFAAFMLICGIGTFTYSLSALIQIATNYQAAMERRMQRQIDKMSGHIIVCGYGRMGKVICDLLIHASRECVVIETDLNRVDAAIKSELPVITGTASDDSVLIRAGVNRAAGIVCAVNSDAENMFITVSARALNTDIIIASRAESHGSNHKLLQAGATMVVSPHEMAGENIAGALLRPNLTAMMLSTDEDPNGAFQLEEVRVAATSRFVDLTFTEVGKAYPDTFFVAVRRADGRIEVRPRGDSVFGAGDVIIIAGHPNDLRRFENDITAEIAMA